MSDNLISRKALMEGRVENDPVRVAAMYAPTAFDKEKVLYEMRSEYADAIDIYNSNKGTAYAYSSEVRKDAWKKAIEIVEKGGIE